ncbi:aminotransferase class IV [Pikeienuella sp. HZG-20]|uniref:aminotransferase class IV n=1 Tax=Paludibacillus litoralis TaxID=3133267 RepID=UPI0030EDE319
MSYGAHAYDADPRNADVLISVNGDLVPRDKAVVSVFDSNFMLGDGVWEGLRLKGGGIPFLTRHLERLYGGARTLDFENMIPPAEMRARIFDCLDANGMEDGVHIRLMVSRGVRATPYQDPRVTITPPTVVIIPEYKAAKVDQRGLSLFTSTIRRSAPDAQDQKLNSHSKLNCIQACIQAAKAGADEALMLDPSGAVATCNSTHFFIVRGGEIWTSTGMYCLGGVTRRAVLDCALEAGIPAFEKPFSLFDVYTADEAFVTGTFAGLSPVRTVDGRRLGPVLEPEPAVPGPMVRRLRTLYSALQERAAEGRDG